MTRTYKFIGINLAELKQFCATDVAIKSSDSTLTVVIEFDGKDSDTLDEYMALRGFVPE